MFAESAVEVQARFAGFCSGTAQNALNRKEREERQEVREGKARPKTKDKQRELNEPRIVKST